jgi:hypothetical protein
LVHISLNRFGAGCATPFFTSRLTHKFRGGTWKRILFLRERSGNVIENKGRLWKTQGLSGNVIENKWSYALKAGMLLKRKEVDGRS